MENIKNRSETDILYEMKKITDEHEIVKGKMIDSLEIIEEHEKNVNSLKDKLIFLEEKYIKLLEELSK